jgi:hypothetical protein
VAGNGWYVTKIETDRDWVPLRIYHRNGGRAGKVTRAWTHGLDEKDACEVCTPVARPVRPPKPNLVEELRTYKEAKR